MLKLRVLSVGSLLLSLLCLPAMAQDLGNSPYSRYGLGDLAPVGFLRNSGMAGVGVSSASALQINEINPALLPYTQQVTFEIAASSQLKRIERINPLNQSRTTQQDGNTTLRYLAFAFPVNKRWTTSIGLKPFSSVSYKIVTETPVIGDTTTKARFLYQGSGGINEVYWSNGVRLTKGLTAGVQASYLFGSLSNQIITQVLTLDDVAQGNVVAITDRKTLKDISLKAGLAYRTKIADNLNLGLGFTYQHLFAFQAKQLRILTSSATTTAVDTLQPTFSERELRVPQPLQAGISLDNGSRWMVGLDFHTQDWAKFEAFGEPAGTLGRSYRVALGGEFTPDPNSVTNYLSRVTYRAGLSYGETPIKIAGTQLKEQQASFGFTLPTGRTGSVVNMAFVAGNRGTTDKGLIKERFYRFELGLALSDRWFQRRQID